jgi:DNA (cytosine-5)-methyltransferase 1
MKELIEEKIVDSFAGGGGTSTGIEQATGRVVDDAINHDPVAIAMHKANHPNTKHHCESVWDVDPRQVANGQPVALFWLSPDCKHFSKAKGGKPVEKNIRGLAWVALRWAATVRPRVIMLENVEEFKTWGPLLKDGKPDPKQKGRTFNCFINALKRQGYKVDYRELRACDYGAPTIRKRFFLVARCDGRPIVWPKPIHGNPESLEVKSGKLKPWRTAAEIIDWSLPCPSIFERKKPLAENTLRRIARGIKKFVIDNPDPFIIRVNYSGANHHYCDSVNQPLNTITAKNGWGLVTPYITQIGQTGCGDNKQYSIEHPLTTIVSKAEHMLVSPILAGVGGRAGQSRPRSGNESVATITAKADTALVMPVISRQFGKSIGSSVEEPLGTVTAGGGGKSQLVAAFLTKHYGGNFSGPGTGMKDPVSTITTVDHNSLGMAFLSKYHGAKTDNDVRGQEVGEPVKTLDTSNRFSLVTSNLVKMRGTNIGQSVTEPLQTITAGGLHFGEVRAFLLKYYGTGTGQEIEEPLHTVTTKDRVGLVTVEGQDYCIVDIGMRMLEPHELFAAQGFPVDYIIDKDSDGNKLSKAAQVKMCGNSVSPKVSKHLVMANLPELCSDTLNREQEEQEEKAS